MAKAEQTNLDDLLTPEQVVDSKSFADLLMLGFPKESYLRLTAVSNKRGLTFAQGLGEAIEDWLKKGTSDE
jgi:hypothetical protein